MENNSKIYAVVDWYDEENGFGIARSCGIPLLIHSSYLDNMRTKLKEQNVISCIPVKNKNIYHATQIELINKLDKKTEELIKQYVKK